MRRFVTVFLFAAVGLIQAVVTAHAADLALVIGNRNYQRESRIYNAESAMNTATALRNNGYSVVSGRDLSTSQTRQALERFLARLGNAERAVVVLNGHFITSGADTWFVPADASVVSLASINYEGLSLGMLMEIMAQKPGGAAVFLGTSARSIRVGAGLEPGIGRLGIPQGVFVATGEPGDIDLTVRRDFLRPGMGFAQALSAAPESVTGQGFISDITSLLPGPGTQQPNGQMREVGYWQAIQELGTEEAFLAYLRNYPNGQFAGIARQRLDDLQSVSPEQEAADREASLGLTRNQRRKIQENLSLLGYDTRGIDGIFGRGTRTAISHWQRDQGFENIGYLTRNQITRLGRQAQVRAEQLAEEARRQQREIEAADRAYWQSSGAAAGNERGLRRYLRRYPDGLFADVAEARLEAIRLANQDRVSARERNAWQTAESENTIASYEAYLAHYPNGSFADDANAQLTELREAEARRAETEAAKQEEDDLNMNVLARILVEKQLLALGFKAGVPDGQFDKKTRRAIRKFQRTRGFPVTGYLTRQTIVRLIAEAGSN